MIRFLSVFVCAMALSLTAPACSKDDKKEGDKTAKKGVKKDGKKDDGKKDDTKTDTKKDDTEKSAPSGDEVAAAMKKMNDFADKMCACKDKACADGVQKDFMGWVKELQKKPKPDKATMEKFKAASKRFAECQMKLAKAAK